MKTVFVIQDSSGKNLEPAKDYGDLLIMLTGREQNGEAATKLIKHLEDFDPCTDFLLLIGNPVFIALSMMILTDVAHEHRHKINLLIWDREHYIYRVEGIYA